MWQIKKPWTLNLGPLLADSSVWFTYFTRSDIQDRRVSMPCLTSKSLLNQLHTHTHTHTNTQVLQADHKLSHQCSVFVPVMIRWARRRVTPTLPQSTRSWKDFSPQTWTKTYYSAWIVDLTVFFYFFYFFYCTRTLNTLTVNCLKMQVLCKSSYGPLAQPV